MTTSHGDGDQETYGDYSVDDEDQPGNIDDLGDDDVDDELDRGYSPPERYSAGQRYGNTPWEEEHRESIDQRVGQEEPDVDPYAAADDAPWESESVDDGEVGDARAGRLVDPDQGLGEDVEKDLVGEDIGIDDGAASAEEAAVHVVEDYTDND
ncbi:DUF5709 domain-containing protein [Nocardioides sp. YIM 152315]|uniref:DUF5709 domain-containing protein n=1 Tax=Nocardioides sp. YIM 152315 TaxID=3031760 RepID=UPI0023DC77A4|nr:DUF5709 domain-containing protein [Nocardioides sp. YIM 152315]MDF1603980.1 DUF5709 domain-containing protein [Nocardioides sp. YIM 152315]